MTVAVVILNWNGAEHLRRYLPSVVKYSSGAEIIVADNGSTDESESVVSSLPNVKWLALPRNYGFAEGYNRALAQISSDVYVLLNSDVRVTAGWLEAPMRRLMQDDLAGAVQPKILADERPLEFEYAGAAGGYIDALGYPYCRGRIFDTVERDLSQYDDAVQVDWATGACCFVRASVWHEVGGLDGSFFAHMEEIDFCWRLRRASYTCWVAPASTVYHLGGGTLAYASPGKTYLNFRNSLVALMRNEFGVQLSLKLVARLLLDGVAGLKFLLSGQPANCWAILRAHFAFYARISSTLKHKHVKQIHTKGVRSNGPVRSILASYYLRQRQRFTDLGK